MDMFTQCAQLAFWKTFVTPDRFSHDQIPDLTGKVAIVTGANTGLGYATTVALAGHGAHVFLACRSKERVMDAITRAQKEIKEMFPHLAEPKMEFLELDLNDMRKSRDSAETFLAKGLPLHMLICNAAVMITPVELSADGIEKHFGVNHMGHFVFTLGLLDRIKESQPSRIVVLSSMGHQSTVPGGIDFETLNDESKSNADTRYGRSKLANILFAKELARRLKDEKVYVNAVHPGFVSTQPPQHASTIYDAVVGAFERGVTAMLAMNPKKGSLTQLYAATSPEVEEKDIRGRYFIPIANEIQPSAYARDEELQEKLWTFSEDLVREKIGS
ncbi:hypothetical protein EDD11_002023 [Mortierella claussenii]|nr:hypothetical protein EDD11_002023 [Mortierella claussenii]